MITVITENKIIQQVLSNPKAKEILRNFDLTVRYDYTMPANIILEIGNKYDPERTMAVWLKHMSELLRNAFPNNPNEGIKYLPWLFRHYSNHMIDWEDATGETVDEINKWWVLKNQNILRQQDQDFNKLTPLTLKKVIGRSEYVEALQRAKNAIELQKAKRNAKQVVLIDDERFLVEIPITYGACYVFNNGVGKQANFCTGGSSGQYWFKNYAPNGPVVMILDKKNVSEYDGKWQFHAPTNQIVRGDQDDRWNPASNSKKFGKLFPGLMQRIVDAIREKGEEIKARAVASEAFSDKPSEDISSSYDPETIITSIKEKFPDAFMEPNNDENEIWGDGSEIDPEDRR